VTTMSHTSFWLWIGPLVLGALAYHRITLVKIYSIGISHDIKKI